MQPASFASVYNIAPYIGGDVTPPGFVRRVVLASNENPYGPSPAVIELIKNYSSNIHSYPSGAANALREAIGENYGIDPALVVTGSGSEDMLHHVARAFAREGDEILIPQHGFGVYKIAALAVGAIPVIVPRVDFKLNVPDILACLTERTKILFIDHPGNPVAHYLSNAEMLELLQKVRKDIVVVIDSAYAEFMDDVSDYHSGMDWVKEFPNVVVIRSFSKAYGMANLRLGWLYAQTHIVDPIQRIRPPFNTSGISQAAGIAALKDKTWVKECVRKNAEVKAWFLNELKNLGINFIPYTSNFVMAHFKNTDQVYQYLGQKGLVVRPMKAYDLPEYLRITIGLQEQMEELISVLSACPLI